MTQRKGRRMASESSDAIKNAKNDQLSDLYFNQYDFNKIYQHLKLFSNLLAKEQNNLDPSQFDGVKQIFETMQKALINLMTQNPAEFFQMQMNLWQSYTKLWQENLDAFLSPNNEESELNKKAHDRRFQSDAWHSQPFFSFIKDCYLHTAEEVQSLVNKIEGLDEQTIKEVDFYTKQFLDAVSPSNFVLTNPDVLKETYDSKGENLIKGFENMLADLKRSQGSGVLNIKMTDLDQFKLGENIAKTKGKVVFQNKLFQLIQYKSTTKEVYQKPLLIIPPFINKYYILDLTEEKSFVKYFVDQGFSVFMLSWVCPDEKNHDFSFEDYIFDGALKASEVVAEITNEETINVLGYCIGGTVLSALMSYLEKKKRVIFHSATFLTTLIDFSEPGDLGVFISDNQVTELENEMNKTGFLDGRRLACTYNLLRSNDLIWNYFINNYLCGKEPFPLDLLYWNSDSTHLAAKSHGFYLRNMYVENKLCQKNKLKFKGEKIDISQIQTPSIFISAEKDHIAPWQGTYKGALLFSGEKEFILSGSGHVAGVINPPSKKKYGFKTNKIQNLASSAQKWYDTAKDNEGSWWVYWNEWLTKKSGKKIKALNFNHKKYKPIEDAPGSYVKVSIFKND